MTPTHSPEAEQSVIGSLIINPEAWEMISDLLQPEDFYLFQNQLIYKAMTQMANKGRPFDAVTLAEHLEASGELMESGGLPYFVQLAEQTPEKSNFKAYAEIVKERSILRNLNAACNKIMFTVKNRDGEEVGQILEQAETEILSIGDKTKKADQGFISISDATDLAYLDIEQRRQNPGRLMGSSSGFVDVDKYTSGLQDEQMIVIAGRPAMGKTSFAMNIATRVAMGGDAVAIFSMEMSDSQLTSRLLSCESQVGLTKIFNGYMTETEFNRVAEAKASLDRCQILLDTTPALTSNEVRARSRRAAKQMGSVGLIVIDYLQLMTGDNAGTRENDVSEISRGVKRLAKELKCPVIALSQLNRSLESRPDKRPLLSDLRESGSIEQDADVVMMLYREEVYEPETNWKNSAELLIRKQRQGPTGMVRLSFQGQYTKFDNYAEEAKYASV